MSSFCFMMREMAQAETAEAEIASTVFTITRCYWKSAARAPLKDGQNMKRKSVPTMAMSWEL